MEGETKTKKQKGIQLLGTSLLVKAFLFFPRRDEEECENIKRNNEDPPRTKAAQKKVEFPTLRLRPHLVQQSAKLGAAKAICNPGRRVLFNLNPRRRKAYSHDHEFIKFISVFLLSVRGKTKWFAAQRGVHLPVVCVPNNFDCVWVGGWVWVYVWLA